MKSTPSESKVKLGRSGKGLVTALVFKTKVRFAKIQKGKVCHRNVREKDALKLIKEFEKIGNVPYAKSIPKPEVSSRYFHLVRCIAKCMMRSDEHNWHIHSCYVEETAPSSNVNVTDEDESKEIIVHETLSENQSQDVSESECNIVHHTL